MCTRGNSTFTPKPALPDTVTTNHVWLSSPGNVGVQHSLGCEYKLHTRLRRQY